MNIDEKLKNNWYLEQNEIQQLIKRYKTMKYLNYLSVIIISVLLLSGCGIFGDDGSDVEEKFEPYRVGSFEFTSPNEATYIGVDGNSKARTLADTDTDTLVVTDPSSFTFEIWEDSTFYEGEAVAFRYSDETEKIAGKLGVMNFIWEHEDVRAPLSRRSLSSGGGIYTVEGYFGSPCEWTVKDDIIIEYYEESSSAGNTPFRVIIIRTNDLDLAGQEVLSCA